MKNYKEVGSFGRGAGTEKTYVVAFEPSLKMVPVEDGILVLSEKAGLAVKYIGQKPMSGFIKRSELWQFFRRVDFAMNQLFEREMNPAAAGPLPYVFKMGNEFKGKTPEQLLLEGMPEAKLLSQREYMARNCQGKFAEANLAGVKAIDRALEAFHNGTLENANANATAAASFSVYKSGAKYFSKNAPQPYKTNGWELNILCFFGDKNPWKIEWTAKVVTIKDNVIVAAENVVSQTASLSTDEFLSGVEETRELFENIVSSYTPAHLKFYAQHKDDWRDDNN